MRALLMFPAVLATALVVALPAHRAEAKTFIQIAPAKGPPGTAVHVEGFGFAPAAVRLVLTPSGAVLDPLSGGGWLPDGDMPSPMLPLGEFEAAQGTFGADVTVPPLADLRAALGEEVAYVDVVAVQPKRDLRGGLLVTGQTFILTPAVELPAAGAAGRPSFPRPAAIPLAGAGAAAAAVLVALRRARRAR